MTVLGWAQNTGRLPAGVCKHQHKSWSILSASALSDASAHHSLSLQVKCFDAGLDFIPTAPKQSLTLDDAIKIGGSNALSDQLERLRNCGQLTLSLSIPDQIATAPRRGRNWLTERKAHYDQLAECRALMTILVKQTDLTFTDPRHCRRTVQCDLLVRRNEFGRIQNQLARLATAHEVHANATLTITGLWPPYGFVHWQPAESSAA